MKNGETIALPFATRGMETLLRESKEPRFVQISRYILFSIPAIEKVSRKVVYLKGYSHPFKVSPNYYHGFFYELYKYLTDEVKVWRVEDYIHWKVQK